MQKIKIIKLINKNKNNIFNNYTINNNIKYNLYKKQLNFNYKYNIKNEHPIEELIDEHIKILTNILNLIDPKY
tara:strand:+ start:375 stop:593 length:219 start_codon:yes stop_codon:yes gene_type:complete